MMFRRRIIHSAGWIVSGAIDARGLCASFRQAPYGLPSSSCCERVDSPFFFSNTSSSMMYPPKPDGVISWALSSSCDIMRPSLVACAAQQAGFKGDDRASMTTVACEKQETLSQKKHGLQGVGLHLFSVHDELLRLIKQKNVADWVRVALLVGRYAREGRKWAKKYALAVFFFLFQKTDYAI